MVGGVVAGQGHVDVLVLLGLTWACAPGGDLTGYLLGRRLGRQFLLKHGPRVHITEPRLARVEQFFARYGLATIVVGRFAGLVRPVASQAIATAKRGSLALAGTVALLVCVVVVYRHLRGASGRDLQSAAARDGRRVSPRPGAHQRARAEDAA